MTPSNDNRRVYSIPVRLYVEARLFILADGPQAARRTASLIDLQDYFGFDPTHVTTDGEGLLRIDDVVTFPLTEDVDMTALTTEEYAPNTHPDFIGIPNR